MRLLFTLMAFIMFNGYPVLLQALSVTPPIKTKEETLETLLKTNQLIVLGTVEGKSTYYEANDKLSRMGLVVFTDVTVKIEKVFKGRLASDSIQVKVLGGCIEQDDFCTHTDIGLNFEEGEKVILFLRPTSDGKWHVWDFLSGKQTFYKGLFHPIRLSLEEITNFIQRSVQ